MFFSFCVIYIFRFLWYSLIISQKIICQLNTSSTAQRILSPYICLHCCFILDDKESFKAHAGLCNPDKIRGIKDGKEKRLDRYVESKTEPSNLPHRCWTTIVSPSHPRSGQPCLRLLPCLLSGHDMSQPPDYTPNELPACAKARLKWKKMKKDIVASSQKG